MAAVGCRKFPYTVPHWYRWCSIHSTLSALRINRGVYNAQLFTSEGWEEQSFQTQFLTTIIFKTPGWGRGTPNLI
jgi:hypothetical protein